MGFTLAHYTTNDWAILFLVLILGFLLGLLARSGGGSYRREYETERAARIEAERANDARIRAANERIAELERQSPHVTGATAGSIGAAASGGRDDLSLIRGIGRGGETRLNELGLYAYRDITRLSTTDEAALEGRMALEPGAIAREQWREQAELLAKGRLGEHRERFA